MIRYLAGGKLGDFIHSLSIVKEKYIQTQQKGIVYLSEKGDGFLLGLETTYRDTFDIVSRQDYIFSYKIYQGEEYDIDLTCWRECDYFSCSYPYVMNGYYSVEWGKHPWIQNIPVHSWWNDKTVVWTVAYRFPYNILWSDFVRDDFVFISFQKKDYNDFCARTNIHLEYHKVNTLMEVCSILRSCKRFVGSFSAPLAFAFGLHTPCLISEFGPNECFSCDFEKVLPQVELFLL